MKEIKSLIWIVLHLEIKFYHLITPSHQIFQRTVINLNISEDMMPFLVGSMSCTRKIPGHFIFFNYINQIFLPVLTST